MERGGPTTLIKRMAWFVERGSIERIWYPVFPPDRNAETVLTWLHERGRVLEPGRGEVKTRMKIGVLALQGDFSLPPEVARPDR